MVTQQNERIRRLQDQLADGILSSEDYMEMKTRFVMNKEKAKQELSTLQGGTEERSELIRKAVMAIDNMSDFYLSAGLEARSNLLSSIFPEIIEFDGEKCRTTEINDALTLCLSIDAGFSEKNRILPEKLEVSGWVEPTGVEPTTFLNQLLTIQNP